MVTLTVGLETLASLMTLLTLGSLRMDMISCSNSTFTLRSGGERGWWEELRCDFYAGLAKEARGRGRSLAAMWSGVVWPWFLRPASTIEWLRMLAAFNIRVCWMVLSLALISRLKLKGWKKEVGGTRMTTFFTFKKNPV